MINKYNDIVEDVTPKPKRMQNMFITFFFGGLFGLLSELLLEGYIVWFNLPRKESGILVTLSLIVLSSFLTAIGVFDKWVMTLKSALIIPITGFAHSMTSAAMDYKHEGLILGIGANIFKLGGTVILYGIVFGIIFGFVRSVIL